MAEKIWFIEYRHCLVHPMRCNLFGLGPELNRSPPGNVTDTESGVIPTTESKRFTRHRNAYVDADHSSTRSALRILWQHVRLECIRLLHFHKGKHFRGQSLSSKSVVRTIESTGPKTSALAMFMSGDTLSKTVGPT